jgi:hypothetical protein
MGCADDPEPHNWKAIGIVMAVTVAILLVGGGALYCWQLPTAAEKAAQDAEARFYFLSDHHASYDDQYVAAEEAKAVYAAQRNGAKYQECSRQVRVVCSLAELRSRLARPAY